MHRHHQQHNDTTDRIAREAARLIETGEVDDVRRAIHAAVTAFVLDDAPPPSVLAVRRHAQAMRMQALGDVGYQRSVVDVLTRAEELMSSLEYAIDGCRTLLMGRAAQGHIDAGVVLQVRAYTDVSIEQIAREIVELEYAEPGFETADTKVGRLSRLRVIDDEQESVITRIPSAINAPHDRDLFHGGAVASCTVQQLQALIAQRS